MSTNTKYVQSLDAHHFADCCLACILAPTLCRRCAVAQVSQMEQTAVVCPVDAEHSQPLALGREVLGSRACCACHLQGTASFAIDPDISKFVGAEFFSPAGHDNWVLGNECRHLVDARTVMPRLTPRCWANVQSRLARFLGSPKCNRDVRCLACHSSLPAASLKRDGNAIDMHTLRPIMWTSRAALGVNCEACHGAAGKRAADSSAGELRGWIQRHVASQTWRYKASAEKQDGFGFYDVRTPASRAAMCLSCHLGDARQGRLVTHAMYAAGHPPLPSFELKSFADMMPPTGAAWAATPPSNRMRLIPPRCSARNPNRSPSNFLAKTADPYFRNLENATSGLLREELSRTTTSAAQPRARWPWAPSQRG